MDDANQEIGVNNQAGTESKPAFVYIVRCADGSYYTGWTTDLRRRVKQHNAGHGARYTRQRGPVTLVYWEEQPDRSTAMKREDQIKRRGRVYKERLVRQFDPSELLAYNGQDA